MMAVTAIWKVESRLDQVIDYTTNEDKTQNASNYQDLHNLIDYVGADYKTEKQFFVSGINCLVDTAFKEMVITKKQYRKTGGILGFHIIQSFKEGEVTPELAHKIGVQLAEELWGDRFEVTVSTHLNTNHYHNHFVLNSVSFKDGRRYYDNNNSYALLRKTSDLICEEYGLSVIEEKKTPRRKIDYEKIYNGQVSTSNYYTTTREDIDMAIAQAYSYKDFLNLLNAMEYETFFRAGKISVRRFPYKRNIRIERAFGEEYSIDNIKRRILETHSIRVPFPEEYSRAKRKYTGRKIKYQNKVSGIYKLYLHYCYLLKIFPRKYPNKYLPPSIRADIKKMDRISDEAKLLSRNNIKTTEQLFSYKKDLSDELAKLKGQKEDYYYDLKRKKTSNKVQIQNEISSLTDKINYLKREELMCEEIQNRIPKIKSNIKEMDTKKEERSKEKYDYFK